VIRDRVPPVDERRVNPAGFVAVPRLGDGVLTQADNRWSIQVDPENRVRFARSGRVTAADVARLRQLRTVTIDWGSPRHGDSAVRVVAGLAAAGVPLRAVHIPAWAEALGTDLTALLTAVDEGDLADDLRREEHSVRLRRVALRTHTAAASRPDPAVSVVLCTRRPEFLGFALTQLARQRQVDLELILTLHGVPADLPEVTAAVAEFDRPVTVVEVPADVPFGTALDRGVARSSGRYVAKWDDDDWYGRDFLADMLLAASYSGAQLVGCTAQFVYLAQINRTIYRAARSEQESRWIAGGTFVMERTAFDAVGGFPPVPRHVDKALLDALLEAGARTYCTHGLGYALHRRATGHTWDEPVTYFLRQAAAQWRGPRFSGFIDPAGIALPHPVPT
jgi:glycosyl transferase family 2